MNPSSVALSGMGPETPFDSAGKGT